MLPGSDGQRWYFCNAEESHTRTVTPLPPNYCIIWHTVATIQKKPPKLLDGISRNWNCLTIDLHRLYYKQTMVKTSVSYQWFLTVPHRPSIFGEHTVRYIRKVQHLQEHQLLFVRRRCGLTQQHFYSRLDSKAAVLLQFYRWLMT